MCPTSQCGNFKIFPSRFYVKPIEFRSPNKAFFSNFGLKFVDLVDFSLQKVQKFMNIEFRASKCVKMANFVLLESQKLISRKNLEITTLYTFKRN